MLLGLGRGHQRSGNHLTAHRDRSCLARLLFARLHQCLERAALCEPVAIVADGVLVGHRAAQVKAEESYLAQANPDHAFQPDGKLMPDSYAFARGDLLCIHESLVIRKRPCGFIGREAASLLSRKSSSRYMPCE